MFFWIEALGIPPVGRFGRISYLSDIETDRKPGSARALQRLAEALRVDMEELVAQPAG